VHYLIERDSTLLHGKPLAIRRRLDPMRLMGTSLLALPLLACSPGSMPRSLGHPLAGVAQVPLTFVIDRRSTVRWVGQSPGDARRAVDVILDE
jgi:hypothetical protein